MTKKLDIMEELDILELIETPELSYATDSLLERKKIAKNVLFRNPEEILFINKTGFRADSVFAGLNEKHIEYFIKNAPIEHKKEIIRMLKDQKMMNGVWEIVKSMDDDAGDGSVKNQVRMKKVVQYIQDNWAVFQF